MKFRENEDPISSTILGPVDMDMSAEDEEATLTMIEDIHADEVHVLETETDPAVFSVETLYLPQSQKQSLQRNPPLKLLCQILFQQMLAVNKINLLLETRMLLWNH